MGGPPYDCLANPLGAVRLTFDKAVGSASDPSSFSDKDWGAADLFRNFLFDQGNLCQVPFLTESTVKWIQPNTLVRFRGMIQDMLGNEFYIGAFKDGSAWRTNKFTDVSQFSMDSLPEHRLWERRLLYCVPVPGLSEWAQPKSDVVAHTYMNGGCQQRDKRRRIDVEANDQNDVDFMDDESEDSPSSKRMREEGHSSLDIDSKTQNASSSTIMICDNKANALPCLVKVYDTLESDLKLNDVFEFIGVLTNEPEEAEHAMEGVEDELSSGVCDDLLHYLPPNKVPRLHCIIHRKLEATDFLQTLPTTEPKEHVVKEIREALLRYLTVTLGNDEVAAEFMLLHLLSKVHARVDGVAVGKLSLNLTGLNRESVSTFGNQLSSVVKNLLPFTNFLPLSVEYLNANSLAPEKDYELNRLKPGVLQLAQGSHLIIDETLLETGTLNSIGVENARLLKDLTELQKVDYNFKYYKMEMTADVQMLILSDGKSNILPADVVVPFRPSSASSIEPVSAEALEAWRWYLATVRSLPHSIESEMQKFLETDLVAARQADRSLGSADFSRLLTMGRLMSASFGETALSLEHWHMVQKLERSRKERFLGNVIAS